jgi:hypothetical protein
MEEKELETVEVDEEVEINEEEVDGGDVNEVSN